MADPVQMMVNALRMQQSQAQMPFPYNRNPTTDFVNRWPTQLPPSGIMNDLKPTIDTGPVLARKLQYG